MIYHYYFFMGHSFRENLRKELNFQNITVKELSAKTGIPIASLDCYLGSRATVPSVDAAYKIAQALQVSVEYLVVGDNTSANNLSKRKTNQEIIDWIESLNPEQFKAFHNMVSIFTGKKKKTTFN